MKEAQDRLKIACIKTNKLCKELNIPEDPDLTREILDIGRDDGLDGVVQVANSSDNIMVCKPAGLAQNHMEFSVEQWKKAMKHCLKTKGFFNQYNPYILLKCRVEGQIDIETTNGCLLLSYEMVGTGTPGFAACIHFTDAKLFYNSSGPIRIFANEELEDKPIECTVKKWDSHEIVSGPGLFPTTDAIWSAKRKVWAALDVKDLKTLPAHDGKHVYIYSCDDSDWNHFNKQFVNMAVKALPKSAKVAVEREKGKNTPLMLRSGPFKTLIMPIRINQ